MLFGSHGEREDCAQARLAVARRAVADDRDEGVRDAVEGRVGAVVSAHRVEFPTSRDAECTTRGCHGHRPVANEFFDAAGTELLNTSYDALRCSFN